MPYRHLTLSERETITNLHFVGHKDGRYRASVACQRCLSRRTRRPLQRKPDHSPLRSEVQRMLSCSWSSAQISGCLRRQHPEDRHMHVSHRRSIAGCGQIRRSPKRLVRICVTAAVGSGGDQAERAFRSVSKEARHSITVDNGPEFAKRESLARCLKLNICFADAYCSWQRGTNENTHGVLRQFLPKNQQLFDLSPTVLEFHVD